MMTSTVQRRADALAAGVFLGVPMSGFDRAGRHQLILLLMAGLEPTSKVVDLGCGVLRGGYWLIHFLDAGCYHGVEPHAGRLQTGLDRILEPGTRAAKQPRFVTDVNFDTSAFAETFDFFLAYSIWTHASKRQIETMLDCFLRDSSGDGVFLTSILPATWRRRDYRDDRWVGTSHESDAPGCIHHSLSWIRRVCRQRHLSVRLLGRELDGQSWLLISRDPRRTLLFRSIWLPSFWRRVQRSIGRRLATSGGPAM